MGNTTQYREHRCFLPGFWKAAGVTSGQGTPVVIELVGTDIADFPIPWRCSILAIGIVLSEPLTAGLLRFEARHNGAATGETFDMRPAQGTEQKWEFDPGEMVVNAGSKIGFQWGTNAAMTPSGSINAQLFVAVQWA